MELEVRKCLDDYLIGNKYTTWYLLKDGTFNKLWHMSGQYWTSQKEAQEFLNNWLPQREWITTEQVGIAADLSEQYALMSSLDHWKQIVLNPTGKYHLGTLSCAICLRAKNIQSGDACDWAFCKNCPLGKTKTSMDDYGCCFEYGQFRHNRTQENAIAMFNRLQKLYNKLFGEKENGKRNDS